ncbi:MAG: hypothetical protein ABJG88_02485 [Litorimonas sp.]
MKKIHTITTLAILCFGITGCAHQTLKAPCGPTAGLTDPCGNRTPINGVKTANIDLGKYEMLLESDISGIRLRDNGTLNIKA